MDGNKPKDLKRAKIEAGDSETRKIVTQAEQSKEKSAHKMTLADLIKQWGTQGFKMQGGKMTIKKYAKVATKRRLQKQSRKRNRK